MRPRVSGLALAISVVSFVPPAFAAPSITVFPLCAERTVELDAFAEIFSRALWAHGLTSAAWPNAEHVTGCAAQAHWREKVGPGVAVLARWRSEGAGCSLTVETYRAEEGKPIGAETEPTPCDHEGLRLALARISGRIAATVRGLSDPARDDKGAGRKRESEAAARVSDVAGPKVKEIPETPAGLGNLAPLREKHPPSSRGSAGTVLLSRPLAERAKRKREAAGKVPIEAKAAARAAERSSKTKTSAPGQVEGASDPTAAGDADAPPPEPIDPPIDPSKIRRLHTADGEEIVTPNGKITIHDDPKPAAHARAALEARPRPENPRVTAGAADDNQQFNAFLRFQRSHGTGVLAHDVSDRIVLWAKDKRGAPLPNAHVRLSNGTDRFVERETYSDGRTLLFPSELGVGGRGRMRVEVESGGKTAEVLLSNTRERQLEVVVDTARPQPTETPLDVVFVLDTTGSMGDEIDRLKATIDAIHFQIANLVPRPDLRLGMVLYRDRDDDYLTRVVPLTRDLNAFRAALSGVEAGGGGDDPEDVQSALQATMKEIAWRKTGMRLAFLIGDATPHLDYGQKYTYVSAMMEAAQRGIKITAIGASGLPIEGEVVWRQIAQYTMAPFVFLTRGEHGDSEGSPSSVSHHVGSNWVADTLDAIIVRMVKVEVAHFSGQNAPKNEDYFSASAPAGGDRRAVLEDLFQQSVKQLTDYAVERIEDRTPTVILPIASKSKQLQGAADALHDRLTFALGRAKTFQLLEQKQRARLLEAAAGQFALAYDSAKMIEIGKLVPARLAVLAELNPGGGGQIEMLVRLVRLETGEVLSLSLLKIESGLVL